MRNIISIYTSFNQFGGAEKVTIDIHAGIKHSYNSSISSFSNYNEINENYNIDNKEYFKLTIKKIFLLKNSIILSHHRKVTSILFILNKLFFLNLHIIHIAHNEFFNLRYFTFFPKTIVAVSQKVKFNLKSYFKIKNEIKVIYNGQKEITIPSKKSDKNIINILYPARITHVKAQIRLVDKLKGKIPNNINIIFAGDGPQLNELKLKIKDLNNFTSLGFIKNINQLYNECNYILLFSKNEGLPLSLIEATKFSKPIICNDVGGNIEICENDRNGFIIYGFNELIQKLNNLHLISEKKYLNMCSESKLLFLKKFSYQGMIDNYLSLIDQTT